MAATLSAIVPRQKLCSDDSDVVRLPPELIDRIKQLTSVDEFLSLDKILLKPKSPSWKLLSELEKLAIPLVMSAKAIGSFKLDCYVVRCLLDLVERVIEAFWKMKIEQKAPQFKHQITSILAGSMLALSISIFN
jgi:hypothetical protein